MKKISNTHRNQLLKALLLIVSVTFFACSPQEGSSPQYRNPKLPVDLRVSDLISRMTVEEKARQLDMYSGCKSLLNKEECFFPTFANAVANFEPTHAKEEAPFHPEKAEKAFGNLGIGCLHDLYQSPQLYNKVQDWVIKSNRLGIPAMFFEEGLHGYMSFNQTVFPQSISLSTTWNPALAKATGAAIGAEARTNGVHMILGPVLDLSRDPRWGRVEENFGEDPYLTGQLGLSFVQGMQGESLNSDRTCIAEPKHFAGHGSPESGLNTSPMHVGEREMRTVMLKVFEPALREGYAGAIMAAYHDIDGVPCTSNPWLLKTLLREEWGFKGFVLADAGAIRRLHNTHHVAATPEDAVCLALNSGVDMQFLDYSNEVYQNAIIQGVKNGKVTMQTLDSAVSRILRLKFMLGLFENPFVDETLNAKVRRSPEHLALSLEVSRQAMCLLKNQNNLLPLNKNLASISVIGQNANISRLGDYSEYTTENAQDGMLEQIKKVVSPKTQVLFADGEKIEAAVAAAKKADVVIMGLGEKQGISGENFDRSDLNLPGNQQALLEAVVKTGKPVVLVLMNGRPLTIPWAAENVPSIIEAWYPGEFGGQAIAETLFGDNNPAGRLTVTFPKSVGQIPVFYNHFPSKHEKYVEGKATPQFVFGHGLSYTTFKYDHLTVTPPAAQSKEDIQVSVEITNTGKRDGDEVAQLYISQTTASVARPEKALKAFERLHLKAGETKTVSMRLKQADLELWDANEKWTVESGEYTVLVGGSSEGCLPQKFILK